MNRIKIIGQKAAALPGKVVLVMIVPEEKLGSVPNIFEAQGLMLDPTIYTGTYPNIRIIPEYKDRDDLKGMGVAGILTSEEWYIQEEPRTAEDDVLNPLIPKDD